MPRSQQLLNPDIHYLCTGNCAYPPSGPDMGPGQWPHISYLGADAPVDGEYKELWRVPRDLASRQSSLYSVLWYDM